MALDTNPPIVSIKDREIMMMDTEVCCEMIKVVNLVHLLSKVQH